MIPYNQLSLADIFQDCHDKFENDKPAFLSLLENHIDIDIIIPISFRNHFYASTGRFRKYPLQAFLWILIIQRIFSIPTDQLLLTFLSYSKPLRDFCGFSKVPDASKITRFKQDFLDDLQLVFDNLVDVAEPICQAIDSAKADMTIFDSSGIEAFVTENNPKYANRIIKQLKAYPRLRALINLTIHIKLPTAPCHPMHPLINPKVFLGDAAFDTMAFYKALLTGNTFGKNRHFSKAYIPLNARSHLENVDYSINEQGIPCCPHDPSLPMKPKGSKSNLRSGLPAFKFVCPKMSWSYDPDTRNSFRQCHCDSPCTSSKCGRMVYIYPEKNLRTYPGVIRGSKEWDNTYKIRTVVERNINHTKENLCLAYRQAYTQRQNTTCRPDSGRHHTTDNRSACR